MGAAKEEWKSAMAVDAKTAASLARECLTEMKCDFEAGGFERHYTKIAVIVPLPKFTYVHRFEVKKPAEFTLDIYDTMPSHGGILHMIEISGVNDSSKAAIQDFAAKFADKITIKPWQISWGERIRTGILTPEFLIAKKKWNELGVK